MWNSNLRCSKNTTWTWSLELTRTFMLFIQSQELSAMLRMTPPLLYRLLILAPSRHTSQNVKKEKSSARERKKEVWLVSSPSQFFLFFLSTLYSIPPSYMATVSPRTLPKHPSQEFKGAPTMGFSWQFSLFDEILFGLIVMVVRSQSKYTYFET